MAACLVQYQLTTDDGHAIGVIASSGDRVFSPRTVLGIAADSGDAVADTCQYVAMSGQEFNRMKSTVAQSSGLPPSEDVAAVWAMGFSLVLFTYLIASAVGSCLQLIRRG